MIFCSRRDLNVKVKHLKNLLLIFLILFAIVYLLFEVYRFKVSKVKTETAIYDTISKSIDIQGLVVRDETLILGDENSILTYLVEDGNRISNNGIIAEVYRNYDDIIVKKEIDSIDKEIDQLTNLNDGIASSSTNPKRINKFIYQQIKYMSLGINDNQYINLSNNKSNILYFMDEYQYITDGAGNLNKRITELKRKKESLMCKFNKSIKNIRAPKSGYFVSTLDGYENAIDYNSILSLKLDDIKEKLNLGKPVNGVVGKIIGNVNWYIIYESSADDTIDLNVGDNVTVTLSLSSNINIPSKIVAINQKDKKSDALIVLKCDYMNKDFCKIRNEKMKVNLTSYEGIKVNKESIHNHTIYNVMSDDNGNETLEKKEIQGVYVLCSGKLKFKQVVPIYSDNNYVICDKSPKNLVNSDFDYLELYDKVVVGGVNLYDGKVIK